MGESGAHYRELALHEDLKGEAEAEIKVFLTAEFARVKKKKKLKREPWPTPENVNLIVKQSTKPSPLFIYAATLIRFIEGRRTDNPVEPLETWIMECDRGLSQLNQMYTQILREAVGEDAEEEEWSTLSDILGTILSLAKPLPAKALA